jgi:hypothetical protein
MNFDVGKYALFVSYLSILYLKGDVITKLREQPNTIPSRFSSV